MMKNKRHVKKRGTVKPKKIVKRIKKPKSPTKSKRVVKKPTLKKSVLKRQKTARIKSSEFTHPNLFISFSPTHEKMALLETQAILDNLGKGSKFLRSEIDGIFLVSTTSVKKKMVKLNQLAAKKKGLFQTTCYWIPIDIWCPANIKMMQSEIKKLSKDIKDTDSWKLELRKRDSDLSTIDLIKKLTEPVDKMNVDLINPDKILWVEIVGDDAGISLLKKEEYLAIPRLK